MYLDVIGACTTLVTMEPFERSLGFNLKKSIKDGLFENRLSLYDSLYILSFNYIYNVLETPNYIIQFFNCL